jgi:predicted small secreted protein
MSNGHIYTKPAITLATVLLGATVLAGCGQTASGTGHTVKQPFGTGNFLGISGTVSNTLAKAMYVGQAKAQVQSSLEGNPLTSFHIPGGLCVDYRGVNQGSFENANTATGIIWKLCFRGNKLSHKTGLCPNPWQGRSEFDRYKKAGWNADPTDCSA